MKFIAVFTLCFAYAYAGGAHLAAPVAAAVVHAPVTSVKYAAVPSAAVVAKPYAVAEHGVAYSQGVAYGSVPVNKVINVPTERYAVGPDTRGYQFTSEVRHDAGYLKAPIAAYAAPVAAAVHAPVAAAYAAPVAAAYAGPVAAPIAYGASYAAGIDHVAAAPAIAAPVAAYGGVVKGDVVAAGLAAPLAAPVAAYGGVAAGLAAPLAAPVAAYGDVVKGGVIAGGYAGPVGYGGAIAGPVGYGAAIAGPAVASYGGVVGEHVGAPVFAGQEPALAKGYATETGRHELHQAVVHEPALIPTAVKESIAIPGTIRTAQAHQVPVQVGVHSEPIVAPVVNKHVGLAQVGVAPVGVKGYAGYAGGYAGGFAAPLAGKW